MALHAPPLPLEREDSYDFAVSYSSHDRARVHDAVKRLRATGYRVFDYVDERVRSWGEPLRSFLNDVYSKTASCYLVFWSATYASSPWPQYEYGVVRARGGGHVVVFSVDGSRPPAQDSTQLIEGARDLDAWVQAAAGALFEREAWREAPGPAAVRVSAVSNKSLDRALLDGSLGAELGPIGLRVPPDLRRLVAGAQRYLDTARSGASDSHAREFVSQVLETTLPRMVAGVRLLMTLLSHATWSRAEVADAIEAYVLAECSGAAYDFGSVGAAVSDVRLEDRGPFTVQDPGRFVGGLARTTRSPSLPTLYWLDADLGDLERRIGSVRAYVPKSFPPEFHVDGPSVEQLSRQIRVRCLAPQLVHRALTLLPEYTKDCMTYLTDLSRINVGDRGEVVVEPRTGEVDSRDNASARPMIRRIRESARETTLSLLREGKLRRLSNRSEDEEVEAYLTLVLNGLPPA